MYAQERFRAEEVIFYALKELAASLRSVEPAPRAPEGLHVPEDVQEWMMHMDLHMTEHDLRHAGLALRAAWPTVKAYIAQRDAEFVRLRARIAREGKP